MKRQADLLAERYDLSNRPAKGAVMDRTKPLQEGVRVKLPSGVTWAQLASMTPDQISDKNLFPHGFLPLPHPNHPEGGMVFPKFQIDEMKKQERPRPDPLRPGLRSSRAFPARVPAAIYLTTRPDLGDVSQGKLVTIDNFYELFNGILNPKQLEGLRLLVTPFPQQQFNETDDRRVPTSASRGVACFDCHVNGHTNGATHLVGDIRPQEFRHRIDTPSLRGVNIQRLFGSQRALKTVEDFTEFEQRAAYFDGDPVVGDKKGVNSSNAAARSTSWPSSRSCSTFPRAEARPGMGKLDPKKATASEIARPGSFLRQGAMCHLPPASVLHRQPDAQPAGRALLQATHDQRPGWRRTARSRLSRCAASRNRRRICTTAGC